MVKKGIPKEVLRELDIKKIEKIKEDFDVTAVVEKHQIKLPIPSEIRRELDFKKGQKLRVKFAPKTKSITYSF